MSGTTTLTEKILQDAETQCQEIIAKAQSKADGIIAKADAEIAEEKQRLELEREAEAAEINRRRMSTAKLDAKKDELALKQQLMQSVYNTAAEKLLSSNKDYIAFVGKLLKKYADKGETVIIAETDKKRITQSFLDGFKKGLVLSKEYGTFRGGIMLSKEGYDKNLTLDLVFDQTRESTENAVTKILFGEKK